NIEDYGSGFAKINQSVLELAKNGQYSELKQKLSTPELKRSFMGDFYLVQLLTTDRNPTQFQQDRAQDFQSG
uniref:hypothetical protein n=1 Tax=Vibrio cholerae TaxID=666 RepID=UPI003B52688A